MSKTDDKGSHHLHIELTPAQYQLLTEKARQCGLTKRAPHLLDQVYELMYQVAKNSSCRFRCDIYGYNDSFFKFALDLKLTPIIIMGLSLH